MKKRLDHLGIAVDPQWGPMPYHPYAGGNKFPLIETLTEKPGFKIWVDGGTLDYGIDTCWAKQLDCRATCCMQSYCAPHMGLCTVYKPRKYMELYIGILVITCIVGGIPTCVFFVELFLMTKFCQRVDEQTDALVGGMTICECITFILTCGKAMHGPRVEADEYLAKYMDAQELEDLANGVQEQ